MQNGRLALLVSVLLLVVLSGCGGLSSEPAIVRTAALPTVTPTPLPDIGHPAQRVSLARGAELFNGAQGCQNCHGIAGQGNGAVAANFTCKLPNATDPIVARGSTVASWFAITTNGNGGDVSCLMPPWKSRLNEQQRWDVTSYLYSLHYTPVILDKGAKLWAENCAACHGERGAGDGPKAKDSPRPVPNFTEPSYLITHSDADLYNSVTHGIGAIMPAFPQLDDDARWSVVAYARSLSWEGTAPAPTPTLPPVVAAPESPTLTVSGKLTNGTTGDRTPADLTLTLHVIDLSGSSPRDSFTAKTTPSGDTFSFKDVPRQVGQIYIVTTNYATVQQHSTPIKLATGAGAVLDLPLPIYEVSSSDANIEVQVQQVFLEFASSSSVVVQQGLSFHNKSKYIYRRSADASLQMQLPSGAIQVTLDASVQGQFVLSQGVPPVVQSPQPVFPDEVRSLLMTYTLPFTDQLVFSQASSYPVQSLVVYMAAQSGYTLTDKTYTPGKPIALKDANNQDVQYNAYTFNDLLAEGLPVRFTAIQSAKLLSDDAALRRNTLAVVLTLALIIFAAVGAAVWRISRVERAVQPVADESGLIIQQIADLDDRYEAGKVPPIEYEAARAQLKAELMRRMKRLPTP